MEWYDGFIAIDFETANSMYFSACSIGIVTVSEGQVTDKQYFLVQPPDNYYDDGNIKTHGITPADTENAPTFPAVWEQIKDKFQNTFVAAHNAAFDMAVLKAVLDYYGIEQPHFYYMDSIGVTGRRIPFNEHVGKSLDARCAYFGVPLEEHHNALCDAAACAGLIIKSWSMMHYKNYSAFFKGSVELKSYDDVKLKGTVEFLKFHKIDVNDINQIEVKEIDDDFRGKTFVFTGELKRMTREQAMQKVVRGGGTVKDTLVKSISVLVHAGDAVSGKVKKAMEFNSKGGNIKIVTEEQFMQMLESSEAIGV